MRDLTSARPLSAASGGRGGRARACGTELERNVFIRNEVPRPKARPRHMLAANRYRNLASTVTIMDARSARPPLPSSCALGACPGTPYPASPAPQAGRKRHMTVRAMPEPADAAARPMRAVPAGPRRAAATSARGQRAVPARSRVRPAAAPAPDRSAPHGRGAAAGPGLG